MTPHHLHALAALLAVGDVDPALQAHVGREARQNAASVLDAATVLRSPVWGVRHASGGHGDPTGGVLLATANRTRETRWADIATKHHTRLGWIADQIHATSGPNPWWRLYDALPRLQPGTARVVTPHLRDEDAWLRGPDVLCLPPAREPLPGVACPHCGERQLHVQTAGPVDAWTVICATGRLCVGEGCPCGMPGAVEGVAHIWRRRDVLAGAVAGAAPTTTTEGATR